ncbi:lysophosphatidic acid phosphatase type [Anaeramoeba flamelloides]|uniref:Lysophosphatidic acid phosphatase type n=1 Tax=Anaeramoeba flamelloides TaxID=1746091 RepID=A0AAV7Y911_9EUKA|nr:lysophosphatidic acid phosphatase type [Anaeramoeba flamelloides]
MNLIQIVFFLFLVFQFGQTERELRFVQVIHRHGDRTPLHRLTKEAVWKCQAKIYYAPSQSGDNPRSLSRVYRKEYLGNREYFYGNCGKGQLTTIGSEQLRSVGELLRTKYVDQLQFLPDHFDNDLILIKSTDIDRTKQSVQSLMLGLYPLNQTANRNEIQNIIDVCTSDPMSSFISTNWDRCPRLGQLYKEIFHSEKFEKHEKTIQSLIDRVNSAFGVDNLMKKRLGQISDTMWCRKMHNLSFPDGIDDQTVDELREQMLYEYSSFHGNQSVYRLNAAHLVQKVVDNIQDFFEDKLDKKFIIYSGHDSSIAPFMMSAHFWQKLKYPQYGSHVELETWVDGSEKYVKVLYNGEELLVDGCDDVYCDWETWQIIATSNVPQNWEEECKVQNNQNHHNHQMSDRIQKSNFGEEFLLYLGNEFN